MALCKVQSSVIVQINNGKGGRKTDIVDIVSFDLLCNNNGRSYREVSRLLELMLSFCASRLRLPFFVLLIAPSIIGRMFGKPRP